MTVIRGSIVTRAIALVPTASRARDVGKECASWWCALADAAQALLLIKPCLMACVSKVCVRCDLLCHHMCLHQLLQGLHMLPAQSALVANLWQPGMHLLLFHLGRVEVRHDDWRRSDRLQCTSQQAQGCVTSVCAQAMPGGQSSWPRLSAWRHSLTTEYRLIM